MLHPCDCKAYNGSQCYNCLNGFHTGCCGKCSGRWPGSFQRRVADWMMETFSMEVTRDTAERNHRFLEESLELVQAMGCTQTEAHMLVAYVYGRPTGEPQQEVGGVMVTLAALCNAADVDSAQCADRELTRCWRNIDKIRAKQAGKPRSSPLPGSYPSADRS
jgi:hypothetical protein